MYLFFEAQNTSLKFRNHLTATLKIDCFFMSLLNVFPPLSSSHRGLCDMNSERRVAWQQVYDCSRPAKPCHFHPSHLYVVNSYSAAFSKAFYSLIRAWEPCQLILYHRHSRSLHARPSSFKKKKKISIFCSGSRACSDLRICRQGAEKTHWWHWVHNSLM